MAEEVRRRRVGWGEVVATGATLVREDGIDALSFEEIARRLETDVADVTYWFGTRLELLSAVIKLRQERNLDTVWIGLADERTNAAKLRKLLEISVANHYAVYWIELWKLSLRDPEARDLREELTDPYRRVVARIIRAGVEAGEFEDVPIEMASLVLVNLVASLSVQATLGDPAVSADRMLALCVQTAEALVGAKLGWTDPPARRAVSP